MWVWKVGYNVFLCLYIWEKRRLQRSWSHFIDICKVIDTFIEGRELFLSLKIVGKHQFPEAKERKVEAED